MFQIVLDIQIYMLFIEMTRNWGIASYSPWQHVY